MSCLHWDEGKFQLRIAGVSRQFSLRILHFVKCQISENLDKYLRNIFHSNDPCRDWLNLAVFDSKGPAFWSPFCLFTKICNPTFLAPEFLSWYKSELRQLGSWERFHPLADFGFAWFLTFCNDNYHCRRSNQESIERLGLHNTSTARSRKTPSTYTTHARLNWYIRPPTHSSI